MFTRAFLLLIFIGSMHLSACNAECSKKVDCPGFADNTLTAWFPYQRDSALVFSTNSITKTYHLKNTETTAPYETTAGGFHGGSGDCFASKQFASTESDTLGFPQLSVSLVAHLPMYSTTPQRSVRIKLNSDNVYGTDLNETGFSAIEINNYKATITSHASLQIDTKTYTDVQVAMRDTNNFKANGIFQLYLSKGNGIVAYREYPSLALTLKQ